MSDSTRKRFQHLRGTSEELAQYGNTFIPLDGEMIIETDTRRFKFGNGKTTYNELPYSVSSGGSTDVDLQDYYTKSEVDEMKEQLESSVDTVSKNLDSWYYTKTEVDDIASNINDDIIVSETEPIVTDQTIWLQPLTTDTGAVDYIVKQGVTTYNNIAYYYEQWNSGIVKCVAIDVNNRIFNGSSTSTHSFTIPSAICKTILTSHITVQRLERTSGIVIVQIISKFDVTSNGNPNYIYTVVNQSTESSTVAKLHHQIIGYWK